MFCLGAMTRLLFRLRCASRVGEARGGGTCEGKTPCFDQKQRWNIFLFTPCICSRVRFNDSCVHGYKQSVCTPGTAATKGKATKSLGGKKHPIDPPDIPPQIAAAPQERGILPVLSSLFSLSASFDVSKVRSSDSCVYKCEHRRVYSCGTNRN